MVVEQGTTAIVEFNRGDRCKPDWKTFSVWDNGGEFSCELINSGELPRDAPTNAFREKLNALTMACRIVDMMRGDEIDFDFRLDDEDERAIMGDVQLVTS